MLRKLLILVTLSACTQAPAVLAPPDRGDDPDPDPGRDPVDAPEKPTTPSKPAPTTTPAPDPSVALSEKDAKELDDYVASRMSAGKVPGVTLAVFRSGKLAYAKGYGLANKATNKKMAPDTIINVASISKTITGVALMQLEAAGKVKLDDDVSKYTGVVIKNPRFPNDPITLRMLLTHTSSIVSNDAQLEQAYAADADASVTLAQVVQGSFTQGGRWYTPQIFGNTRPGTSFSYCNVCLATVGLVVERVSGVPFAKFTKDNIFTPLGMSSTTWLLADTDKSRLATPYSGPQQRPEPQIGLPDWPAGSLKTTASDLAAFASAVALAKILAKPSVDQMLKPQAPSAPGPWGLVFYETDYAGIRAWGHGGDLYGIGTVYGFTTSKADGAVALANADRSQTGPSPVDMIEEKAIAIATRR